MGFEEKIEGKARINIGDQLQWAISSPRQYFLTAIILTIGFGALGIFLDYSNYGSVDAETFTTIAKAVVGCLVFLTVVSNACMMAFSLRLSAAQKEMEWSIDGSQIALRDATNTQVIIPWTIVKSFGVRKAGLRVDIRPSGSRWIPARAFSEQQRYKIVELARNAGVRCT